MLCELLSLDLLSKPNVEIMHLTFQKSEQVGHCKGVVFFSSDISLWLSLTVIEITTVYLNENNSSSPPNFVIYKLSCLHYCSRSQWKCLKPNSMPHFFPFAFLHFIYALPHFSERRMGGHLNARKYMFFCWNYLPMSLFRFLLSVETLDYYFYSKRRQVIERRSSEQHKCLYPTKV